MKTKNQHNAWKPVPATVRAAAMGRGTSRHFYFFNKKTPARMN
jgi:hypothetical protein